MKSSKPQINEKMKITLVESEIRKEKKKKRKPNNPNLRKDYKKLHGDLGVGGRDDMDSVLRILHVTITSSCQGIFLSRVE